ncbi:MarR family transcriptional regulator [Caulobacter sp. 602-1]|nr:MarR family transcriptional regulator [Caulobacter sp. 602-1]
MANKNEHARYASVGAWAKRCYLTGRSVMDSALRPHGLGATQWYVLHQLAEVGPTMQRDLVRLLEIERATLSIVIASLVRKGLVEQVADAADMRQKQLFLTPAGRALWDELPDLGFIQDVAFDGLSKSDIEIAARVLRQATERLQQQLKGVKA